MSTRMDNNPAPEREPTTAEQVALRWVVRCDRGLSHDEEQELATWLALDSQHQELFAEFGGTWAIIARNAPTEATANTPEAELPFETNYMPASASLIRTRKLAAKAAWISLAAAAAVAVAFIGWRRPELDGAAIATEIGGLQKIILSDGSVVELNTDSVLVNAFTPGERRVRLAKGEAYFTVAKDPSRPFIVEAADVGVRAVGTAFNVRVRSESVEVLVTHGKVRVAPGASNESAAAAELTRLAPAISPVAELVAGDRVIVPANTATSAATVVPFEVARVGAEDVQRALAWQTRRLDFSDTSLAEMVAEFNRYNRHQLAVFDATTAALRFGGSFRLDDRVGFVRVLRENFGIVAEEQQNQTILRAAH